MHCVKLHELYILESIQFHPLLKHSHFIAYLKLKIETGNGIELVLHSLNSTTIVVEVSLPGLTRPDENLVPRSTRLPRSLFLHPCSYSYQARFKVRKGRYLTICLTKYLMKLMYQKLLY